MVLSHSTPLEQRRPGDYIALFGTGFGLAAQATARRDCHDPPRRRSQTVPSLFVDGNPVASLSYSGLAPGLVGVDQINFQLPAGTRNGCSVPVLASQTLGSPSVTIGVQAGRGHVQRSADPVLGSDFFEQRGPRRNGNDRRHVQRVVSIRPECPAARAGGYCLRSRLGGECLFTNSRTPFCGSHR